jgi:hypothetical protein
MRFTVMGAMEVFFSAKNTFYKTKDSHVLFRKQGF